MLQLMCIVLLAYSERKSLSLHLDCWKEAPRQIWSISKLLYNTKCHPNVRWLTSRWWY